MTYPTKATHKLNNMNAAKHWDLADIFRKHSEHHWSTIHIGQRLDFWPATMKWRWRGKTMNGTLKQLNDFLLWQPSDSSRYQL